MRLQEGESFLLILGAEDMTSYQMNPVRDEMIFIYNCRLICQEIDLTAVIPPGGHNGFRGKRISHISHCIPPALRRSRLNHFNRSKGLLGKC